MINKIMSIEKRILFSSDQSDNLEIIFDISLSMFKIDVSL